ncbi:MAG: NAD-dependent epimerase/dehydratase family protein [Pseudomonadales bacterium]
MAVLGVSSQLGVPLVLALSKAGHQVSGISRATTARAPCDIHVYDPDTHKFKPPLAGVTAIISLAPLPNIPDVLDIATALHATRIIAFGSTGVFSKETSTSDIERRFVRDQLNAERLLARNSQERQINWTLFRPTMIYGADADQNVTFISNVIRKCGFFPIPIGANGLRQPVHVNDLATACVAAIDRPATFNRAYNLGGGETIRYSEMVRRISRAAGRRSIILPVPRFLYRWIVGLLKFLPGLDYIRVEMIDRMFVDLIADNTQAHDDFGFQPHPFQPERVVRLE